MNAFADLHRSSGDAKLAGVCVAIAKRWQVDPLIVRIAAVVLALSSGIGIVLYGAAWLLMPREQTKDRAIDSLFPPARDWPSTVWLILIIFGCIITVSMLGSMMPFGVGPALILAAMWYFGYYRKRSTNPAATTPPIGHRVSTPFAGPPTPFTEAAASWQQRVMEYRQQTDQVAEPARRAMPEVTQQDATAHVHPSPASTPRVQRPLPQGDPSVREATRDPGYSLNAYLAQPDPVGLYQSPSSSPVRKPVRPRARRRLGFASLIIMGLALGGLGIADVYYRIPGTAYVSVALLVIGLTLIVGTWFGRPRGLLALGIVLALILGPTAAMEQASPAASRFGTPGGSPAATRYTQLSELPLQDNYDFGQHTIDLSELNVTENRTFETRVDMGELRVRVPKNTNLKIEWTVDLGEAKILDGRDVASGSDLKNTTVINGAADPNAPQLTLILGVNAGQLEVTQ